MCVLGPVKERFYLILYFLRKALFDDRLVGYFRSVGITKSSQIVPHL
jgi:hypothetical protein